MSPKKPTDSESGSLTGAELAFDLLGKNPYDTEDPRHETWKDIYSTAVGDLGGLLDTATSIPSVGGKPEKLHVVEEWFTNVYQPAFDICAEQLLTLVTDETHLNEFSHRLEKLTSSANDTVRKHSPFSRRVSTAPPPITPSGASHSSAGAMNPELIRSIKEQRAAHSRFSTILSAQAILWKERAKRKANDAEIAKARHEAEHQPDEPSLDRSTEPEKATENAETPGQQAFFLKQSETGDWLIGTDPPSIPIRHLVGLSHIAELVSNPHTSIAAVELQQERALSSDTKVDPDAEGLAVSGLLDLKDSPEELRDGIASLKEGALQLKAEIEDATAIGDHEEAERLRSNMVQIEEKINRDRKSLKHYSRGSDNDIRAAKAVRKVINKALERIDVSFPEVANYLKKYIERFDFQFTYKPPPDASLSFQVERPSHRKSPQK